MKKILLGLALLLGVANASTSVNAPVAGGGSGGDAITTSPLSQFAATTSLQLKGILSDETGSGAACFATSPALVTPDLGTPSALVLTNATGLPLTSGYIPFGASGVMSSATNLQWDSTNKFIHVDGGNAGKSKLQFTSGTQSGTTITDGFLMGPDAGSNDFIFEQKEGTAGIYFYNSSAGVYRISVGSASTSIVSPAADYSVNVRTAGIGMATNSPDAVVTIKAGTSAASTAPLKFLSGTNMTSPEAGAVEYNGDFYFTLSNANRIRLGSQDLNAQTGTTYTLVLTDQSKLVTLSNASAITLTVPTNASVAYAVGSRIDLVQLGAGQVTVVGAGGVTVNGAIGLKARAQYSPLSLVKVATDTWILVGDAAS